MTAAAIGVHHRTLESPPNASALRCQAGDLFWLAPDMSEPHRAGPLIKFPRILVRCSAIDASPSVVANRLPPYESLAVDASGAYIWGDELKSVVLVDAFGGMSVHAELSERVDGGLYRESGRLFLKGQVEGSTSGVFVLEPRSGRWQSIYDTGRKVMFALRQVAIGSDRVFYERYTTQLELWSVDHSGGDARCECTIPPSIGVHSISATPRGVFIVADEGLFEVGPDRAVTCWFETKDAPPSEAAWYRDYLFWITDAVVLDGELRTPYRLFARPPTSSESILVLESDESISQLTSCRWGVAFLEVRMGHSVIPFFGNDPIPSFLHIMTVE